MNKQKLAYFYAIAAVLLWSTVASAFKISLRHFDFLQLLFISSLSSLVTTFLLLFVNNNVTQLNSLRKSDFIYSAGLGFLNPFLYYVILFKAYSLLPAQQAQPLNYTWPIMLVLLSAPLLKQRITKGSVAAITVCFAGIIVISTGGNIIGLQFTSLSGVLLALGSAIIWALFWICNVKQGGDSTLNLLLNFAFGFIYICVATLLFSELPSLNSPGLLAAVYVGVFEMGITFVLWSKALSLANTTAEISKFVFLSPFLSLVFIYFLLGEKIQLASIIGLMLIVLGIVLEQINSYNKVAN